MPLCSACTHLKSISLCTDSVVIGEAPLANTPYVVYFKSLATDAIYSYHITSDSDKMLTLEFIDGFPLASGLTYDLWINESGDSIESKLPLIIGETTDTCYTLVGNSVFNIYYEENENFSSQTLEVL